MPALRPLAPLSALRLAALLTVGAPALACGSSSTTTAALQPGARAPSLQAAAHDGTIIDLTAPVGTTLVYFYPRDGTPGCTKEACAIRDSWQAFEDAGVTVIGVSTDDPDSHRKFAKEHGLPFLLVSDEDRAWANAFGVDSTLGFHDRDSFLIGPDGSIAKVYRGVDPTAHASDVLRDATLLSTPTSTPSKRR